MAAALREMRRVEEEMRKRERVEEEKRKAEEVKEKEQEKEQLDELQIEKDEKYVNSVQVMVLAIPTFKYNIHCTFSNFLE